VSELPVTRWPPGADVDLHWPAASTTYLAFIYISMDSDTFIPRYKLFLLPCKAKCLKHGY